MLNGYASWNDAPSGVAFTSSSVTRGSFSINSLDAPLTLQPVGKISSRDPVKSLQRHKTHFPPSPSTFPKTSSYRSSSTISPPPSGSP